MKVEGQVRCKLKAKCNGQSKEYKMDTPVEYTRGELNKLDPCCANCEFIGAMSVGCKAACQIHGNLQYDMLIHVCPDWEINMDIDETDGSQDDDVILYS